MPKLYETITAENWVKEPTGFYAKTGTKGCLLAHLSQRLGERWMGVEYGCLVEAAKILFPDRIGLGLGRFNDHPDTTLEDILRVCKVADV